MYRACRKGAKLALLDASSELKMARETLVKIEYFQEEAHPKKVVQMCELYNAGKRLAMWHCANHCSIGRYCGHEFIEMIPTLAGMQLLGAIDDVALTKHNLVQVLRDGRITRDELPIIDSILNKCHEFTRAAIALELEKEKTALRAAK
ncbi:Hypothetical protein LUCI_0813 [Lucifera butyrica]|uniref:Uncharacterized protein n=1 Tax=Lucifera butyrica TaxID=1351585 RepID=A0A498R5X2_9FIRM|nr:hypothetical protein [Lucifera butyrica]VBB05603.1 Hypothetical protein LUCI_0813 [Lucifera butyrica]